MYLGHYGCEDTRHACRVSDRDRCIRILGVRMCCIYIGCLYVFRALWVLGYIACL